MRDDNVVTRPYIIVDSWNALKGTEFDAVILINVDYMNKFINHKDEFKHIAGLYAAMTRARDHLVITFKEENEFIRELKRHLQPPFFPPPHNLIKS